VLACRGAQPGSGNDRSRGCSRRCQHGHAECCLCFAILLNSICCIRFGKNPGFVTASYGVDWLVYAGGALASGSLFLWVGEIALVLPIAAVIAAVIA
jgi:hypothetical protein